MKASELNAAFSNNAHGATGSVRILKITKLLNWAVNRSDKDVIKKNTHVQYWEILMLWVR